MNDACRIERSRGATGENKWPSIIFCETGLLPLYIMVVGSNGIVFRYVFVFESRERTVDTLQENS